MKRLIRPVVAERCYWHRVVGVVDEPLVRESVVRSAGHGGDAALCYQRAACAGGAAAGRQLDLDGQQPRDTCIIYIKLAVMLASLTQYIAKLRLVGCKQLNTRR